MVNSFIKKGKSIEKNKVAGMKKSIFYNNIQDWFRELGTFFSVLLHKLIMTKQCNNGILPLCNFSSFLYFQRQGCRCYDLVIALCLFLSLSVSAYGQRSIPDSLKYLFLKQLTVFPQEKIYLHTDKSYYITGEKIWFRAYLVDAVTHVPFPASRYVYVELFNPLDSLISRVKIRNDNNAYYGHINIPPDIPEGDYTIRAYTTFMLNQDEHYFCTKTVRIGNPDYWLVHVEKKFSFGEDGTTNVDFSFINASRMEAVVPKSVLVSINGSKMQQLKVEDNGMSGISFKLPADATKRVLLLDVKDPVYACQFIPIPSPDNNFDVTFYPEGGYLLQDVSCRVAFKAQKADGHSANVDGVIYDYSGKEKGRFTTDYQGMGSFVIYPAEGDYCMVSTKDNGQSKRFELPKALKTGYAITVNTTKDKILVSVKSVPEKRQDTLYLLAHTRGMIHFVAECVTENRVFNLSKNMFPSGVLHLALFDEGLHPVSERLVFVNNDDQAQMSYQSDKKSYFARSLVENTLTMTDEEGSPLTGSFSVAVTDDSAVTIDSTTNILTQLLLSSDLRGYIENPAAYFRKDNTASYALDLLMQTQGWRRYDLASLAKGHLKQPTEPLEIGPVLSGRVRRLLSDRPVENSQVSIASSDGLYFDVVQTDSVGRFEFSIVELPDSAKFLVHAIPNVGKRNIELFIDKDNFLYKNISTLPLAEFSKELIEQYIEKAASVSISDTGIKNIALSEVIVTAKKPIPKSVFRATYTMDEKRIQDINKNRGMITLLEKIPEILIIDGNETTYQYLGVPFIRLIIDDQNKEPLIYERNIDEILEYIDAEKIKQLYISDLFSGMPPLHDLETGQLIVDPNAPPVPELVLICNDIDYVFLNKKSYHIKIVQPLGYQKPVEFYATKYDTPEKRNSQVADLRTTIHWQPDVRTDSLGIAKFDFYSADSESSYTVIIEGVTIDGKLIHKEGKIYRKD